jgi:L-cysteine:1D-myo-inositol 2-amino-2-deoxy-alpha-D-glucopyranoside ligase
MAAGTLGAGLDVLVGGEDLAFPHHAMQAAMAEAATEVSPFARARMHVGAVRQGGAKMAKSRGNLTLVSDLLAQHRPAAVRLLLVDRRWSSAWDWSPSLLEAAEQRLDRLYAAAGRSGGAESAEEEITAALLSDLDVPRALAAAEEAGGAAARLLIATLALG